MPRGRTRTIGGLRFKYYNTYGTKSEAQKSAKQWRKDGTMARVIKAAPGKYEVWLN